MFLFLYNWTLWILMWVLNGKCEKLTMRCDKYWGNCVYIIKKLDELSLICIYLQKGSDPDQRSLYRGRERPAAGGKSPGVSWAEADSVHLYSLYSTGVQSALRTVELQWASADILANTLEKLWRWGNSLNQISMKTCDVEMLKSEMITEGKKECLNWHI